MIKLSEIFGCSINALVTGIPLIYNFKNKKYEETILVADHLLTIEEKSFLIKLIKKLLKYT